MIRGILSNRNVLNRSNFDRRRLISTSPPSAPLNKKTKSSSSVLPWLVAASATSLAVVVSLAYVAEENHHLATTIDNIAPGLLETLQPVRKLLVSYRVVDIIKEILEPTVEKKVEEEKYVVKHPEAVAVVEITTPADNVEEKKVEDISTEELKSVLVKAKALLEKEEEIEKAGRIAAAATAAAAAAAQTAVIAEVAVAESKAPAATTPIPVPAVVAPPLEPEPVIQEAKTSAPPAPVPATGILPTVVSELAVSTKDGLSSELVNEFAKQSQALRKELETRYLQDIQQLQDPLQLRSRVIQLAGELFERISLEGIRMDQMLRKLEAQEEAKNRELLNSQRRELETEAKLLLQKREEEILKQSEQMKQELLAQSEQQLSNAVRSQAEGFKASLQKELQAQAETITADLQSQIFNQVALLRKGHVDQIMEIQPRVESLHSQIVEFSKLVDESSTIVRTSVDAHVVSSAVMALELSLSNPGLGTPKSIKKHLEVIETVCKDDELVRVALATLPPSVREAEVLSLSDLQVRFQVMKDEVRKTALAPDAAPALVGQLIGTALAQISWSPKGYVPGDGVEEVLARAQFFLDNGRLKECLKELNEVKGYSKIQTADWSKLASDRLAVDVVIKVLKARAILRHKAYTA